jgi:hypothetical protein
MLLVVVGGVPPAATKQFPPLPRLFWTNFIAAVGGVISE